MTATPAAPPPTPVRPGAGSCSAPAACSARPGRSARSDALAEVEGFDPHDADIIVGTSAGSVLAALLGAGLTVGDLLDHQRGMPLSREVGARLGLRPLDRRRATRPGRGFAVGLAGAAAPHARPAPAGAAAGGARRPRPARHRHAGRGGPDGRRRSPGEGGWVPRDGVWVVAMDYDSGRRVAFGRRRRPRRRGSTRQ